MGNLVLVQNKIDKSKSIFDFLKTELTGKLSSFDFKLEHIGSTAIPNALTKPILDALLIADNKEDWQKIANTLPDIRFIQGELDRKQTKLFFHREISDTQSFLKSIHLHLVFEGSGNETDFVSLKIKNYLLSYPKEVSEYNNYKEKLAKDGNNDRNYYVIHKEKFMKKLLSKLNSESKD